MYVRGPLDHLAHKENVVKQVHQVLLDRVVVKESKVKKERQDKLVIQDHRVTRVLKEGRCICSSIYLV